jgi:hypothetical protein
VRPPQPRRQPADRIRLLIGNDPDLTEKKMFGGLAFLIGGNVAIAASGHHGARAPDIPFPRIIWQRPS